MRTKVGLTVLVLLLSGCEACKQHPMACAAATGILATSLVLCTKHSTTQQDYQMSKGLVGPPDKTIGTPRCGSVSCQ